MLRKLYYWLVSRTGRRSLDTSQATLAVATVVVTGAARGIGFELARQYGEAGVRVFAMAHDPASAKALNDLAAARPNVSVHAMDVASDASVIAGAAQIDAPVDLLFNVAGLAGEAKPLLAPGAWADFDQAMEVMLKGPLRVLQSVLPRLREGSKVINITSQLGASTWSHGGHYPYVAAKAGLNRLMRSVAIDLKDRGIVIGLVHPGWVRTDLGGPKAALTPAESVSAIRALAAAWPMGRSGDFLRWNGETHPW